MQNETKYSLFVNTTDSFEDCWMPFFTLFAKYWPSFKGQIYLNTERKEFRYPGLNIISIKNGVQDTKSVSSWSTCLQDGLRMVTDEVVLYMQEDYFLESPVDVQRVEKLVELMLGHAVDCIHLTDQHSAGPFDVSEYPELWKMGKRDFHKISCQAALWKTSVLRSYIRSHENPWQFEMYGTLRAQLGPHQFYTLPRNNRQQCEPAVPYIFTGVIQGKWFEPVVQLFDKHKIKVDYTIRGFIGDRERFALLPRLKRKWKDVSLKSISGVIKTYFTKKTRRLACVFP